MDDAEGADSAEELRDAGQRQRRAALALMGLAPSCPSQRARGPLIRFSHGCTRVADVLASGDQGVVTDACATLREHAARLSESLDALDRQGRP